MTNEIAKSFVVAMITCIILVFISGLLFFEVEELKAQNAAESQELEINQSWDDGWYVGWSWGASEIFEQAFRNGVYVHNETWKLYSPNGCAAAFTAELQAQGCEVRCP